VLSFWTQSNDQDSDLGLLLSTHINYFNLDSVVEVPYLPAVLAEIKYILGPVIKRTSLLLHLSLCTGRHLLGAL
jgi:hypothetical protein